MTREELSRASDHLQSAASATTDDDASERLTDLSGQVETLAEAEHGPDHGRLARLENALLEVKADVGADAVDHINAAHTQLKEYRSGVEGV